MKILTVTFHRSKNYGAALQTYALQQALQKCGYNTAVVDYSRTISTPSSHNPIQVIKKKVICLLELLRKKERDEFRKKFNRFVLENIRLTATYHDYESLMHTPPDADMYLIGSDQVWNITHRYRPEFFADFAPQGVRVASYAASIGRYDYNDWQMDKFRHGIEKVSPISVREQSGVDFLQKNFGKLAEHHLDPVFLLTKEEWGNLEIVPDLNFKYILCYALSDNQLMHKAAKKLKKLTGYKIVSISPNANNFIRGDVNVFNAGPKDFLGYIDHAEYVLTTSFHGTAFSIIFEKKFFNFTLAYYSSRTNDLLERMGLTHRVPKSIDDINPDDIDYVAIAKRKRGLVEQSYEYLCSFGKQ